MGQNRGSKSPERLENRKLTHQVCFATCILLVIDLYNFLRGGRGPIKAKDRKLGLLLLVYPNMGMSFSLEKSWKCGKSKDFKSSHMVYRLIANFTLIQNAKILLVKDQPGRVYQNEYRLFIIFCVFKSPINRISGQKSSFLGLGHQKAHNNLPTSHPYRQKWIVVVHKFESTK